MQPIFSGHSIFFDGKVNAKGLKPIHRKLGHRCGKWASADELRERLIPVATRSASPRHAVSEATKRNIGTAWRRSQSSNKNMYMVVWVDFDLFVVIDRMRPGNISLVVLYFTAISHVAHIGITTSRCRALALPPATAKRGAV